MGSINVTKCVTYGIALIAVLVPIAIAPGWSLYFDVVPKTAQLLLGAAMLLLGFRHVESSVARTLDSRAGRSG
jgi:hypothetical protein